MWHRIRSSFDDRRKGAKAIIVLAVGVLLVLVGVFPASALSIAVPSSRQTGGGMMSSGSSSDMMSGSMGMAAADCNSMMGASGQTSTLDNSTFNSINSPPVGVSVDAGTNTVSISSNNVTIPVEAAPVWYPQSGDYWLIYGLVNPTIRVDKGLSVNFLFINMDNDSHMPAITTISPPYSDMPMMQGMMGDMMGQRQGDWLAIGPMLNGVSVGTVNSSTPYTDTTLTVTFNNTGAFWYLCLAMGHAQMGMYGEILVTAN